MTILPKKKQTKEKSEAEKPAEHQHSPHSPSSEPRVGSRRPPSPSGSSQWSAPPPVDERLTPHVDPGGMFDEFASHESSSNHNKRRHRSSPHRSVRKHRHERHERTVSHQASHALPQQSHPHRHGFRPTPSTSADCNTEYTDITNNINNDEGCNSGDEYSPIVNDSRTKEEYDELETCFEKALKEERGLLIRRMREDGACLFRAVADQIYGDQEMHSLIRQNCVDYMAKNHDFFKHYITEEFSLYLARKRMENCHGNHVEIQAISELYNRPLEVYQYSTAPINTFHGTYKTDNAPIRLSYHRNAHYNSVVDPYQATIGVGLGLPEHKPGSAEKNLVKDASVISENFHIEQTMLEDKLRQTDWEVTQETMEEQVARESYLQWLREQEKRATTNQTSSRSASATCSTATEGQDTWWDEPPRPASLSPHPLMQPASPSTAAQKSPVPGCSGTCQKRSASNNVSPKGSPVGGASSSKASPEDGAVGGSSIFGFSETTSLMNELPPQLYGLSDWDDEDVMSQVLAQSQQEYLDNLKRQAVSPPPPHPPPSPPLSSAKPPASNS